MSTVYISFQADINPFTTQTFLAATFDQIGKGATHIYYLLSTMGGRVTEGITIYNIVKGLPVKTTMHNAGAVNSIGNAIFLAGQERVACAHSTFMFHGVGFDITSNCRLEEKTLTESLDSLKADQRKIAGVIAKETKLVSEDIDGLFLQAQTKDPTFALETGIISEIRDVAIPRGAPVIQLVFKG